MATTDDEPSSKPREMVHRAQAESINAIYRYQQVHQGLLDETKLNAVEARASLHNAVMLYWRQMDRFSNRGRVEDIWHDEEIYDGVTLEDLRLKMLTVSTEVKREYNAANATEESVRVEKPWRLTPQQAIRVHEQLDRCAHKLGFDASPKRDEPTYGWIEVDDENNETTDNE